MKTKRILLLLVMLIVLPSGFAIASDFLATFLPEGVRLGANVSSIRSIRLGVTQNVLLHEYDKPGEIIADFVELQKSASSRLAYSYRFKDDQLGSVLRSSSMRALSIQDARLAAAKIYNDLRSDFRMTHEEMIVRSNGTTNVTVTAQLWQGGDPQFSVYFVATTYELTLVVFNPLQFSKADFFLGAERLPEIASRVDRITRLADDGIKSAYPTLTDLIPDLQNLNP